MQMDFSASAPSFAVLFPQKETLNSEIYCETAEYANLITVGQNAWLSLRESWRRSRLRGENWPYCKRHQCETLSLTCGDSFPKGGAKA